nr:hypothetical protein [Mycoplasmopsis bovis]
MLKRQDHNSIKRLLRCNIVPNQQKYSKTNIVLAFTYKLTTFEFR